MGKRNTILDFFKRQNTQSLNVNVGDASLPTSNILVVKNSLNKFRKVDINVKNSPNEELTSMNLILFHWNMIVDCIVRYEIMILVNVMKFKELTLKLVCINIIFESTENLEKKIIFVAFNLNGSSYFLHSLNIRLIKMQHLSTKLSL